MRPQQRRRVSEREGIPMKKNYGFCESNSWMENEFNSYCADTRSGMELNWSDDSSWDTRESVEHYISHYGFRF